MFVKLCRSKFYDRVLLMTKHKPTTQSNIMLPLNLNNAAVKVFNKYPKKKKQERKSENRLKATTHHFKTSASVLNLIENIE